MKRSARGFTLMELMVVLSIAAAILVIGAPSFNQFRLNNRLTNTANDALATIVRARAEAIKLQSDVSMCRSNNPRAASPTCADAGTAGYIVFRDPNRNCVREGTEVHLGSETYDDSFAATDPLRARLNGNCLSFAATGFRQNITAGGRTTISRLVYCDNRGIAVMAGSTVSAARGISISQTGRARITRVTAGSGAEAGEGLAEDISTWADATCP
jgi:type IV fimbrial biogenesis protein FimT